MAIEYGQEVREEAVRSGKKVRVQLGMQLNRKNNILLVFHSLSFSDLEWPFLLCIYSCFFC